MALRSHRVLAEHAVFADHGALRHVREIPDFAGLPFRPFLDDGSGMDNRRKRISRNWVHKECFPCSRRDRSHDLAPRRMPRPD